MATWSSANNTAALTERQALLNKRLDQADSGFLKLYNASNTVIASCALSATSFGNADASCIATANAVTADLAPTTGETISYAKIMESNGTTEVISLTAGLTGSGADVIVSGATLTIPSGAGVAVASITIQG